MNEAEESNLYSFTGYELGPFPTLCPSSYTIGRPPLSVCDQPSWSIPDSKVSSSHCTHAPSTLTRERALNCGENLIDQFLERSRRAGAETDTAFAAAFRKAAADMARAGAPTVSSTVAVSVALTVALTVVALSVALSIGAVDRIRTGRGRVVASGVSTSTLDFALDELGASMRGGGSRERRCEPHGDENG